MRIGARQRVIVAFVATSLASLVSPPVAAQVHSDVSAQVGLMKRFLTGRPSGERNAGVGPTAEIGAHIALLPLVRAGAYIGHDISPSTAAARDLTWAGARVKIVSPWPSSPFRAWLFAGFGYAGVYARSYATQTTISNIGHESAPQPARVQGASGGFFEVPLGLGASYKLRKPWELCAELGARVGFAYSGSAYKAPGPELAIPNAPSSHAAPAGRDAFALGLTIGLLVDL
ncbi:MAG: hypothetical protein FWD73_15840 [Polyangiaceae bacterium]|nr:hypothetical protein [Polyangiaceae bacterium]